MSMFQTSIQGPIQAPTFPASILAPILFQGLIQAPTLMPLQGILAPLALKRDHNNLVIWCSLVFPAICAFDLEGFLNGIQICLDQFVPVQNGEGSSNGDQSHIRVNPEYLAWIQTDQAIMVWLLGSISEVKLGHIIRCTRCLQTWTTISILFSSNSKARLLQLHFQLQMLKKRFYDNS